jgi:hypothetical protein
MRPVRILRACHRRRTARYLVRAAAVTVLAGVLLALSTGPVWAQPPVEPPEPNSLDQVVDNLRWWIMGIIAAVATLFLVVGGLRYITAGGDPSQVEQAKGNLKSALLGYGLAVLAPVFMTILSSTILGV